MNFKPDEQYLAALKEDYQLIAKFLKNRWELSFREWDNSTSKDCWMTLLDKEIELCLKENNWRQIIVVKHIFTVKENIEKWGYYQSPKTKKIYNFLGCQNIILHDWNEDLDEQYFAQQNIWLNELIKDFTGNEIHTSFRRIDGKNKFEIISRN